MSFSNNRFPSFENGWSTSFWQLFLNILLLSFLSSSLNPPSLSFLFLLLTLPSFSLPPSLLSSFLTLSSFSSVPSLLTWSSLPLLSLPPSLNLPPSCYPYTFTLNFPFILSLILSSFLRMFFLFLILPFFINITQGMAATMLAIVIVGLAKTIPTLYMGLTLFSFGKSYF